MAGSLKDQLLKAGVASKKQAKDIELEKRRKRKQGNHQASREDQERAAAIEAARLQKIEKDRALNAQRKEAQTRRAVQAEIRQLAEQHGVQPPANADIRYQFVWNGKVRSLWVDADLQGRLAAGTLGLVVIDKDFVLVPAAVAERIGQRDPAAMVGNDDTGTRTTPAEEAEYADFPIPDDLHW